LSGASAAITLAATKRELRKTAPAAAAAADKELTENRRHRFVVAPDQRKEKTNRRSRVFTAEAIKQTGLTTIADVVRSDFLPTNSGTLPTAFGIGFAAGCVRCRVARFDRELDPGVDRWAAAAAPYAPG